jgi:hypothetical protein
VTRQPKEKNRIENLPSLAKLSALAAESLMPLTTMACGVGWIAWHPRWGAIESSGKQILAGSGWVTLDAAARFRNVARTSC